MVLLEKFSNIMNQRSLTSPTQDQVPYTDHGYLQLMLNEDTFPVKVAAVGHDATIEGRKRLSPEKEMFEFCIRFSCHGLKVFCLNVNFFS